MDYKQEPYYSKRHKFTFQNAIHVPGETHFLNRTVDADGNLPVRIQVRVYGDAVSLAENGSPVETYYADAKIPAATVNAFKLNVIESNLELNNDYMP